MRVEVTFGGDSAGADTAVRFVEDALKALQRVALETGVALDEVKIDSSQASETELNARRMQSSLRGVQQEARQTRRDLEQIRLASFGSGSVFGGLLPGGARARTGSYALAGVLGAALTGPVGAAAVGGLAALPALATGGAAAVGVLELAFHGLGKAISGNRQEFEKLNPDAQAFVQTLRSLQPWVEKLQQTAQRGLFPGLTEGLHSALTPANAQMLEQAVSGIAGALGDVAREWGRGLGSKGFTQGFGEVLQASTVWLREGGDAAEHFAAGIGKITVAGIPLTNWMVHAVDDGSKLFDNWVKGEQASGGLQRGLEGAKHELILVAKFAEAVVKAAFELAAALKPLGEEALAGVTRELNKFSDWVTTHRQEISDFALHVLHDLEHAAHLVEDAFHTLGDVLGSDKVAAEALFTVFAGWKIAGVIAQLTGASGLVSGLVAAETAAGRLRLAMLAIGGPAVIAALAAAAYGAYQVFKGDKTAGDVVEPGNPYIKGSPDYYAYNAGVSGVRPHKGQVSVPGSGGGTIPASDPAYRAGVKARAAGTTSTTTQGFDASNLSVTGAQTSAAQSYIQSTAAQFGLDPTALIGVANNESANWSGAAGDNNTSFGPFQLHIGGALPASIAAKGAAYANAWAWSPAGINYALGAIAKSGAKGLSGKAAVDVVVRNFERPANPAGDLAAGYAAVAGGGVTAGSAGSAGSAAGSPFGTPPPFSGKGSNILPYAYRLAISAAGDTLGNSRDDVTATMRAVEWLRANLKSFTGEDLINARDELSSLQQSLVSLLNLPKTISSSSNALSFPDTIGGTSKLTLTQYLARAGIFAHGTGQVAGLGALTSARGLAQGVSHLLGSDPLAQSLGGPQTVEATERVLANLRAKLGPEIKYISRKLTGDIVAPDDLSAMRAQLDRYKGQISTALDAVKQAVQAHKTDFEQAFKAVGNAAIQALQDDAATWKSPAQIVLDQLQSAHDDAQLQAALDTANKDLANALVPKPDANTIVENVQAIIGQYTQASVIDQVQSAVLGISPAGVDSRSLLGKLRDAMTGAAAPDPQEVARAQQEVEDAKYEIQVAGLQKQATAEQTAHDRMISEQERAIQQLENQWDSYYVSLQGKIGGIGSAWATMLASLGVGQNVIAQVVAGAPQAIADTIGGTASDVSLQQTFAALDQVVGAAQTPVISALLNKTITGGAYGPKGPLQLHATGGIAVGPVYRNVIGEAGPEALIPLNDPRAVGMLGGGDVAVHIHTRDEALADFIDVRVDKATPRISRNLGVRTSDRLRSGRY